MDLGIANVKCHIKR